MLLRKISHYFILPSLILAGEAIFFLPFVIARVFRPTLLMVFEINNAQLGTWFSVYGVVAMVCYFLGGPLADRFPARNLMALALVLTSLGGVVMAFIPCNVLMLIIYGFWGTTTILLFWAALIRATHDWGGSNFQGRAFGWLEGGRGLTAALIGTFALLIFSARFGNGSTGQLSIERIAAFKRVLIATSALTFLSGILIWFVIPTTSESKKQDKIEWKYILKLFANPRVLLLSVIILCAYVGYKITDVFSLYSFEVLGMSETRAAAVGSSTLWVRAIVAVLAGFVADRFSSSLVIRVSFGITLLTTTLSVMGIVKTSLFISLCNLALILVGIYAIRALYFALISEARLPDSFTGSIVGIVSVVGFTPDIFMGPWIGYLLDQNPGSDGFQLVFMLLAGFSGAGLLATILFKRYLH